MSEATVNAALWRGRRVLVTGHTGFKGGWLTVWLHALGARVFGLALPPDGEHNLFTAAAIEPLCERHELVDIRDAQATRRAIEAASPEVIFHLAAQPLVRLAYREPLETYATNVMGTAHVLDAARRVEGLRAIIVVTSDKCYENREWLWGYREDEPMGGHDPYSSSKGCAELLTASWRRSFFPVDRYGEHGVVVASARAGNVLGGGDWSADRLVPDAIRAWCEGQEVVLRHPEAVRPWQHVVEPLRGYMLLAEHAMRSPAVARGWNFGPQDADIRTVGEVIARLADCWGEGARWRVSRPEDAPHEARLLKLDSSQARARLEWLPQLDLQACMSATASWYKAHRDGASAAQLRALMLETIAHTRRATT